MNRDFVLNDSTPARLVVRQTSRPDSARPTYSVVADYGWAERILCAGSNVHDANSIARILSASLYVPALLARE
jgi:hypothetical protein